MDIGEIAIQPDNLALQVAYRPIYFMVYADSLVTPQQPMYADVYFVISGSYTYIKTFTAFSTSNVGGTNSTFEFDIQDAAQEYLKTYVPRVTVNNIDYANPVGTPYGAGGGAVGCMVSFRGSTYSGGVLVPNAVVPVQGTSTTPPHAGTGTASNQFLILNATLPPDNINDNLWGLNSPETLLQQQYPEAIFFPDQRIYGLSNLPVNTVANPDITLCPEVFASDHGAIPLLIIQFGTYGGFDLYSRTCDLVLIIYLPGGGISSHLMVTNVGVSQGVYYLPSGMQEIALLVPSALPILLNGQNNVYYRVILADVTDPSSIFPIYVSPGYRVRQNGPENVRLWFQNYWGHLEQLSFTRNSEKFTTVSSQQFKPYLQAINNDTTDFINKTGRQRFNVRVQDEKTFVGVFPEALMPWIKELLGSPYVLLDVPNLDGFPTYPVNMPGFYVKDDTFQTRKTIIDGRINYEITVHVPPSLDYITLRN